MAEAISKKEILQYALEYVSDEEERRYNYLQRMYDIKGVRISAEEDWRKWYQKKIVLESMVKEAK